MSDKVESAKVVVENEGDVIQNVTDSAVALMNGDTSKLDGIWEFLTLHGMKLLTAVAIFFIGRWVARRITVVLARGMRRAHLDQTLIGFLNNIVYGVLLMFVIVAALAHMGIETTSLAAVIGGAGLAIGLALQGSLSNFAAGALIVMFRFFKVGDYVEVAGKGGTVTDISIFTTRLNTPDNVRVIVPNNSVTSNIILNYTANDKRRLDLVIGVSYDADLKKTQQILKDILDADSRVLADPAPVVEVLTLNDSSVDFAVRPWVTTAEYWDLHFDFMMRIKLALDEAGIGIPYPQRDVYLHVQQAQALVDAVKKA